MAIFIVMTVGGGVASVGGDGGQVGHGSGAGRRILLVVLPFVG